MEELEPKRDRSSKQSINKIGEHCFFCFSRGECSLSHWKRKQCSDRPETPCYAQLSNQIVTGFLSDLFGLLEWPKITHIPGRNNCVHSLVRKREIWPATKLIKSENKRDGPIKSGYSQTLSALGGRGIRCARTSLFFRWNYVLEALCGAVVSCRQFGRIFVFLSKRSAYVLLSRVTIWKSLTLTDGTESGTWLAFSLVSVSDVTTNIFRFASSLQMQPPLIRSRDYVWNAKRDAFRT